MTYLVQLNLAEPIPLKVKPMSSKLKARLGNGDLVVPSGKQFALAVDFSFESLLLSSSLPLLPLAAYREPSLYHCVRWLVTIQDGLFAL